MSDDDSQTDLGPMPEAESEAPQLHPGGPDAVLDREPDPLVPDLAAEDNPATEDSPVETSQGEDTSTMATRDEEGAGDGHHPEESPA